MCASWINLVNAVWVRRKLCGSPRHSQTPPTLANTANSLSHYATYLFWQQRIIAVVFRDVRGESVHNLVSRFGRETQKRRMPQPTRLLCCEICRLSDIFVYTCPAVWAFGTADANLPSGEKHTRLGTSHVTSNNLGEPFGEKRQLYWIPVPILNRHHVWYIEALSASVYK